MHYTAQTTREKPISAAIGYSSYLSLSQPRVNVIEEAIQAARNTGSTFLASCLNCYGNTLRLQGQYNAASLALEEARERHARVGDNSSAASCLWSIGEILHGQGRFDEACSKLEEARHIYIEVDEPSGAADCLFLLGKVYETQGNFDIAMSTLEQARAQFNQLGAGPGPANCLRLLGWGYFAQGQLQAYMGIAHTLLLLSAIHCDQIQFSEAYSAAEEAISLYARMGDKLSIADSQLSMGKVLIHQGRYNEAHRCA
ncbi:hypothetical protein FRC02_003294 [Tulasnella sp. 418]|nr:hypothetical protein FRC02_003294 [Tulasnella sp. 418]